MTATTYTNHLLVAMPSLKGQPFEQSVIYLCHHDTDGAVGFILNRPIQQKLSELFKQLEISYDPQAQVANQPLYVGGPVQTEQGFILHKPDKQTFESSIQINDEIAVTTSKDVLEAISQQQEPEDFKVAMGYAGWDANQLEKEIKEGSWLVTSATEELVFATAQNTWQNALKKMGITDIGQLAGFSGHA